MSDQYLWDGSGEPDREIEMLERKLAVYKFEPRLLTLPEKDLNRTFPFRPLWQLAVAASIAILFAVGILLWVNRSRSGVRKDDTHIAVDRDGKGRPDAPDPGVAKNGKHDEPRTPPEFVAKGIPKMVVRPATKAVKDMPDSMEPPNVDAARPQVASSSWMRLPTPLEVEASSHIERAQMLLRSFKNSDDAGDAMIAMVAFDRSQAQQMLYDNILLRRSAEMGGNLPLQEVLGDLEPFLLDIANLPQTASVEEVQVIRDRIRSEEIVTTLQAYAPPPARAW